MTAEPSPDTGQGKQPRLPEIRLPLELIWFSVVYVACFCHVALSLACITKIDFRLCWAYFNVTSLT